MCGTSAIETAHHLLLECPGSLPAITVFCATHSFALGPSAGGDWKAQVLGCCPIDHLKSFVELVGALEKLAEDQEEALAELSDIGSSSEDE